MQMPREHDSPLVVLREPDEHADPGKALASRSNMAAPHLHRNAHAHARTRRGTYSAIRSAHPIYAGRINNQKN